MMDLLQMSLQQKESQKNIQKTLVNIIHHLLWLAQKLKFQLQLQIECIISKYMMFFNHRSRTMTIAYGHTPFYDGKLKYSDITG